MSSYYGAAAAAVRKHQACFGGPADEAAGWLRGFVDAGAEHLVVRLTGDQERQIETLARIRESL